MIWSLSVGRSDSSPFFDHTFNEAEETASREHGLRRQGQKSHALVSVSLPFKKMAQRQRRARRMETGWQSLSILSRLRLVRRYTKSKMVLRMLSPFRLLENSARRKMASKSPEMVGQSSIMKMTAQLCAKGTSRGSSASPRRSFNLWQEISVAATRRVPSLRCCGRRLEVG